MTNKMCIDVNKARISCKFSGLILQVENPFLSWQGGRYTLAHALEGSDVAGLGKSRIEIKHGWSCCLQCGSVFFLHLC